MDYEKKYKEALSWMQSLYNSLHGATKKDAEHFFPELKESEDEKIRKRIIALVNAHGQGMYKDEMLAWLEKQGKQKETLCDKCKKTQPSHSCQDITALGRCALEKQGEQKRTKFEKAVKQVMEEAIECGDTRNLKADAEMLLSLVHKSAWSEEGKRKMYRIYSILGQAADTHAFSTTCRLIGDKECIELQDFLKYLTPQSTWKPSDEQMKQLGWVAEQNKNNMIGKELMTLYQDLKKLRKE